MATQTNTKTIQEHEILPKEFNPESWNDKIKNGICLNPHAEDYEKYFVKWQSQSKGKQPPGYYSTYVIGAQNIGNKQLVITPKKGCDNIDFLKIFNTCFFSGIESNRFNKIYKIDFAQPKIKTDAFKSVLTPLIVVHYLSTINSIMKKGLKKNYVDCSENIRKIKGRICISRNDRINVLNKRFDRIYCRYQEYAINTAENRLLKKALTFSQKVLQQMGNNETASDLTHKTNIFLQFFGLVDDRFDAWEVCLMKKNKLYVEYDEAIELAKMILQRFDYSITQIKSEEKMVSPFWIDMPLLYEHYVLGLLKEAYKDQIIYQFKGHTGFPDFLYLPKDSQDRGIILDSKYIPKFENEKLYTDIIRQLSGYSRDSKIRGKIKASPETITPCVIIYPYEEDNDNPSIKEDNTNPFKNNKIIEGRQEESNFIAFYKIRVPLPTLPK